MIDVICPVYFVDHEFKKNVKSWFKELPIRVLYFGVNNSRIDMNWLKTGLEKDLLKSSTIEVIDQLQYKTLGYCIADLMKKVGTTWFAYLHADVELTPYCYEIMKKYMKEDIGIIESERVRLNSHKYLYDNCFHNPRSYSGFQIIQKKAIESIIEKIEDDYIYRNEDFVFMNAIQQEGFEYVKSWSMHLHKNRNRKWSKDKKEAMDWQWKGLIKYTTPDPVCFQACLDAFDLCLRDYGTKYTDIMNHARVESKAWKHKILNYYTDKMMSLLSQ